MPGDWIIWNDFGLVEEGLSKEEAIERLKVIREASDNDILYAENSATGELIED